MKNEISKTNLKSIQKEISFEKLLNFLKNTLSKNSEIQNTLFESYYIIEEVFLIKKEEILKCFHDNLIQMNDDEFKKLFFNKISTINKFINKIDFINILCKELSKVIKKRLNNIPLEYIFKKKNFYGNIFYISKNVLIPRFDSEILIEKSSESFLNFLTNYKNNKKKKKIKEIKIIDICCGSGCLGISLAVEIEKIINEFKRKNTENNKIFAINFKIKLSFIDISKKALNNTKINVKNILINKSFFKVKYSNLDLLEILNKDNLYQIFKKNYFDYVLYNPPYIASKIIKNLSKEVQQEPLIALDGGLDGLSFYKELKTISQLSYQDGYERFFIEIGYDQKKDIERILNKSNIKNFTFYKDLNLKFRLLTLNQL